MSQEPERAALDHRLIIVTGKGGTGKTMVTAALALTAVHQGKKLLVVETGFDEHLPRILSRSSAPSGYGGREIRPGITSMRIDPYYGLAEYLGIKLGVRAPLDYVLKNQTFRQFMNAAPGWRELIMLGKIWHLEQKTRRDGKPLYDLILVDAPATGHGLTFLEVPHVMASAIRTGPLHRQAQGVETLIKDHQRTLLLPVTLAEELPVNETLELIERAREEVGIKVNQIIVNAMMPSPFPKGMECLDEWLRKIPDSTTLPGLPSPQTLADCATYLRSRYELNRNYIGVLKKRTQLPTIELPYLTQGIRTPDDLEPLSQIFASFTGDP